jgi:hypothetical protein
MIKQNPDERYQTALEVWDLLNAIQVQYSRRTNMV